MNAEQKEPPAEQKFQEKKLTNAIRDWVSANKKIFWKYEVSCFYRSYVIRITNRSEPAQPNIMVVSHKRLLNEQMTQELCDAITNAEINMQMMDPYIDVQVDMIDEAVTAVVI